MKLKIDPRQREGVIEDLPYAQSIRNEELREQVYDAWAMSLSSSSFERINDMACSGGPGGPELRNRGQAAHLNGVARIGAAIHRPGPQGGGAPVRGRHRRGHRRRPLPRPREGLGVRPAQPGAVGGRSPDNRHAIATTSPLRRARRAVRGTARADSPHRGHSLGRRRAHHAEPGGRDHRRRGLHILATPQKRPPPGAIPRRRVRHAGPVRGSRTATPKADARPPDMSCGRTGRRWGRT